MSKVGELAKQLFGTAKDAALTFAPGLANLGPDLMAEGKRQLTQSSMEIAAALFSGNGFVQYGPGQRAAEPDRAHESVVGHPREGEHTPEQEQAGMER